MAENGIQPRVHSVGTTPLEPVTGSPSKPKTAYNSRAYEWPRNYPNDPVTAGLDPKTQFLITQGLQLKDTDSEHKPLTPKNEISYAQSLQRRSYWNVR